MFKLYSGRSSKYNQANQKRSKGGKSSNYDPLGAALDIGSYFGAILLGLAIYFFSSFTDAQGSFCLGFGVVFIFKGAITIIRRRYYSYEYVSMPEIRSVGKGAIWWGILELAIGITFLSLGLFQI